MKSKERFGYYLGEDIAEAEGWQMTQTNLIKRKHQWYSALTPNVQMMLSYSGP